MQEAKKKPWEREKLDFTGLFTFELANNHNGSVEHGRRIIREVGTVAKRAGIKAAFKFQFRDLDTFIHPDYRNDRNNKHIARFLGTALSKKQFKELAEEVRANGFYTMATPFDEKSVELIEELDIDIVKVASCSAKDWPLLERIVDAGKPIIASTGGLTLEEIDNLVSFLDHKYSHFAIMHCVSIYPTPVEKLELNQVRLLRRRYPGVAIGFSTHESPDNYEAIQVAYTKGATIFERHVGIPTETVPLNKYSSTPDQIGKWIDSYKRAIASVGKNEKGESDPDEVRDLKSLMRGVFAKRDIRPGEEISKADVFFAIPLMPGQMTSGEWKSGFIAGSAISRHAPLPSSMSTGRKEKSQYVYKIVHEVKGFLREAGIPVVPSMDVELSHHYGIEHFREVGATIIDCINRDYCKKIIVVLPGQRHPYHHHKKKEETFHVLSGELIIEIEGREKLLVPGDLQVVERGIRHSFSSKKGVVFEEVSTTHFNNDSIYEDPAINKMAREERKTKLINWGRHQFE